MFELNPAFIQAAEDFIDEVLATGLTPDEYSRQYLTI